MPAVDLYPVQNDAMIAPCDNWRSITPDDENELPFVTRMIVIANGGDLHFIDNNGHEDTVPVPAGAFPTRLRKVFSTGTTATGISGQW